jgi:hypothetical protein
MSYCVSFESSKVAINVCSCREVQANEEYRQIVHGSLSDKPKESSSFLSKAFLAIL